MSGEPLANGRREIYTLNVEQADAHALITEDGKIELIDADKKEVADQLDTVLTGRATSQTDTGHIPIDTFVLTHLHDDHTRGVEELYDSGYEIQHVVQPDRDRYEVCDLETGKPEKGVKETVRRTYAQALKKHDPETIRQVAEGDPLTPDSDIQVLAPPSEPGVEKFTSPVTGRENTLKPTGANANSLAFKIERDQSVLFMGDVEDTGGLNGESWLMHQHDNDESDVDLDADILILSHHGSPNATCPEFLERVDPNLAMISSDLSEQFDHPHDEVLKNLHEHDVDVYWTAGHGTMRNDLDEGHATEQATDLETTAAADLAALKHYCRKHDTTPEDVKTLAPGNLPEWVAEAAPMVAQTPEEMVDAAITNAETVRDVHQTLADYPPANRYLREVVQNDRDEHVTYPSDVRNNRIAYKEAYRDQAAAQPSRGDRVRRALPFVADPDLPEYDGPAPEEIEGPFTEDVLSPAVKNRETAATIRDKLWNDSSPPDYLVAAEKQANTAVENAESTGELCKGLRETPGAHKDVMKATETPYTHLPEDLVSNERETTREVSADLSHDESRGKSL